MPVKGTVLVIDDQRDSREAVTSALEPLGFRVVGASSGEEGIAAANTHQPDVILLDVLMPGMDGYEVCQRLKQNQETQLIPVVFLTGFDSREARLRGLELGASDFLTKPFDLVELEVRVRNLVAFRHLTQDLDDAEQILLTIAKTAEARDAGTGDHCDRLSHLAARLGERIGLGEVDIKALRRAGYLHDIGKIGIPDRILLKRGPLDEEEWKIMRSHVEIGVRMCTPLRTLRPVLPIIRHHHEKWNGTGYPDGLVAEEIPFLARVFQVVDVFDALTSERPYRRRETPQGAMAIIRDETALGWWDPCVVDAFARYLDEELGC